MEFNPQNNKSSIDISKIKNVEHKRMINKVLRQENLTPSDLKKSVHAKQFALGFTTMICDIAMKSIDFDGFRYSQLITREGELLKGTHIAMRCKDIPEANEIDQCPEGSRNCTVPSYAVESQTYEDLIKIRLIMVSDVIDKYCLYQRFCSDASIDEFINMVKRDLYSAITLWVERRVEKDFSKESNYAEVVTLPANATPDDIVRAIRRNYHRLQLRNRLNKHGVLTRSLRQDIWAFININASVDYELTLACCMNAESRLGDLYTRMQEIEFIDENNQPIPNLVAAIYDKNVYPIRWGQSEMHEIPCPSNPIVRKDYLYNQVALDFWQCWSAILIKLADAGADDKVQVDDQIAAYQDTTSTLDYTTIAKTGNPTAEQLGINKPTGGTGTTDTYTVLSTDATNQTVTVSVTVTKNSATATKTIVITAKPEQTPQEKVDEYQAEINNQSYKSTNKTTAQLEALETNFLASEAGITLPNAPADLTVTFVRTAADEPNKNITTTATVSMANATSKTATVKIFGSDSPTILKTLKTGNKRTKPFVAGCSGGTCG